MTLRVKRGTRAKIDLAANRGELLEGEPLLITDEDRIAIGTSPTTYESFAKQSESGGGGTGVFTTVKRTSNQTISANTPTKISWDAEFDNTVSAFSTGAPTRITVPVGKTYARVNANIPFSKYTTSQDTNVVKLLLHMNGSNGSTTFTDSSSSNKVCTASGGAQISTAQSKYGGSSGLFSSGAKVECGAASDWTFLHNNSTDWTIDLYMRMSSLPGVAGVLFANNGGASNEYGIFVSMLSTGKIEVVVMRGVTSSYLIYGVFDTVFAIDTFYQLSFVFTKDDGLRLYVNGTEDTTYFSILNSAGVSPPTSPLNFGANPFGSYGFSGYLDEIRIVAKKMYYRDFTAATSEFDNFVYEISNGQRVVQLLKNNTVLQDPCLSFQVELVEDAVDYVTTLQGRWFGVAASDYLELQITHTALASMNILSDGTNQTTMQVEFI